MKKLNFKSISLPNQHFNFATAVVNQLLSRFNIRFPFLSENISKMRKRCAKF